ncbi:MAG: hypothetical protein PVF05_03610 [Gemmatimonadales bacterium]|jgi:hypothetical protein
MRKNRLRDVVIPDRPAAAAVAADRRRLLAAAIGLFVAVVAIRGIVPVGAGIYYDDGIYLALAHSLAHGDGYAYANLPGHVPGVKYPPGYPAVLAAALKLLPPYPQDLPALKALNGVFTGLAAALSFLVFLGAWRSGAPHDNDEAKDADGPVAGPLSRRAVLAAFGVACVLGYASAQTMTLATALMSEPLWLVATFGALWFAGRRKSNPVLLGLAAAAVFLVRGIGIAVVAAVLLGELMRHRSWHRGRLRRFAIVLASAALPCIAWIAWSRLHAAEVPAALAGQYGTYGHWYAAALGEHPLARLPGLIAEHWGPLVTNLELLWIPDAAVATANVVLVVLGVTAVVGMVRLARRNPALALFPPIYLAVVLVWPFEPDRFIYAVLPTLTLCVAAGVLVFAELIRRDLPKWGGPAVTLVAALLVLNSARYELLAHENRAWAGFQATPAAVFEPMNAWIRDNTPENAVIAAVLDPHVYWETGRKAVPSSQYRAPNFGSLEGLDEELAAELEQILAQTGAGWIAVVQGEGRAGATMAAFARLHPDRVREVFSEEVAPYTGVIYEVEAAAPADTDPAAP